uniref:Lipid-binding serum glycoprotein N-terminal domain-containing protein n=1 Tax=Glossina pallidipes TaxID=7398 RepID=A0A1A9Z9X3_GLOPL
MKSYIFQVTLILLSLHIKPFVALKEGKIKKFINELNLRMCHPIPKLGLPALDPLEIRNFTVTLDNKYLVEGKVQNTEVHIKWRTKVFSPKLVIEDLKITFDIGQALLNIGQLIEDPQIDNFVHEVINDLGVELLNDLWMEKNETIISVTQKEINNFIGNYTMHDFFQFVDDMASAAGSIFAGIPTDCKNTLNTKKCY